MRNAILLLAGAGVLALLAAPPAGRIRHGYNVATEETFTGKVIAVADHDHPQMRIKGRHIMLQTEQGASDIHLGPVPFLEQRKLTIAAGDELEVTGSKITLDGQDAVIARLVKKGTCTFWLRSKQGAPLWARRWRMK